MLQKRLFACSVPLKSIAFLNSLNRPQIKNSEGDAPASPQIHSASLSFPARETHGGFCELWSHCPNGIPLSPRGVSGRFLKPLTQEMTVLMSIECDDFCFPKQTLSCVSSNMCISTKAWANMLGGKILGR